MEKTISIVPYRFLCDKILWDSQNPQISKLPTDGKISNLPLRAIISNIGNASYPLAKYLAQLLSPLTRSRYTVNSTKDPIVKIKN